MKRKSKDKKVKSVVGEKPQGRVTRVDDFLPPPDELFRENEKIKITIEIDGETLEFFRKHAAQSGGKYQRLIREVLKHYAQKYSA